jgi:beta-lactamase regulating signal transducer with metallopeptidase domain
VNDALTNLGSGVVLAWIALPLLAMVARRGDRCDAASSHRACVWALVLGASLLILPFARAGTESGPSLSIPGWLEHLVGLARGPHVNTRLGAFSPLALAAMAWIAMVAIGLLRSAVQLVRLQRICARAVPAPADIVARIEPLARAVGIRCPPVLVSSDCSIPFAAGVLRPVVVLPRGVIDSFAPDALELVALHELTHIARGDLRAGALVDLARLLLTPHPSARRLALDACLAREQAVDACVAAEAPVAYARVLVDVAHHARFGERMRRAVCMHDSDLARRIDAMGDERPRQRASLAPLIATTLAIAGSTFAAPRIQVGPCPAARAPVPCSAAVECPLRTPRI